MTSLPAFNNFDTGQSSGTAISTGNSGGGTGNTAFDAIPATNTPTYSSTQAHRGSLAMSATISGSSYVEWTGLTGTDVYCCFYIYMVGTITSGTRLSETNGGTTTALHRVQMGTSGKLSINVAGSGVTNFTTVATTGQWIRVEYHAGVDGTTATLECKLFNTADSITPDETISTSHAAADTSIAASFFGVLAASSTANYLDDVGASSTGYIGPSIIMGSASSPSASSGEATGTASDHVVNGTASGSSTSGGSATGTVHDHVVSGTAVGSSTSGGAATGTVHDHVINGTASGSSTSSGAATGTAHNHVISGTAAGSSSSDGSAVGVVHDHVIAGTAAGSSTSSGAATGHAAGHAVQGTASSISTSWGAVWGQVDGKIAWPPLVNPLIINLTSPQTETIFIPAGVDAIVKLPSEPMLVGPTVDSAIAIDGGRNVVVSGGEIYFQDWGIPGAIPTENAGNGVTTQSGRCIAIYNNTGTVHLEGLWFHGWGLAEGFDCFSNGTVMCVVQDCRFGDFEYPIQNRWINVAGYPTIHPDGVSIAQGYGLTVNNCDFYGAYQMVFCRDNALTTTPCVVEVHNTQLNACNITGLDITCASWYMLNSTGSNNYRDSMAGYSIQTTAATQSHAIGYTASASYSGALATYECSTTPAFVQQLGSARDATTGSTIAVSTTQNVAAGDTIIAAFTIHGSQTLSSVSGGGLTWHVDIQDHDSTEGWGVAIASANCPSGLTSETAITGTLSATGSSSKSIMLGEFSGVNSSSPLDKTTIGNLETPHATGFSLPATAVTSQDIELVVSVWTGGFTPGGTLSPSSLNPPSPLYAAQFIWLDSSTTPFFYNTMLLDNVWANISQIPGALNTHVHPSVNDPTPPTVRGDGSIDWPANYKTGYSGRVVLGPTADFTRPGGTVGGPGFLYGSSAALPATISLLDTTEDELMIRQKIVTLSPSGSDGTASTDALLLLSRPGILRYLEVLYTGQASTTNLTIQTDSASGATVFTASANNSTIGPALLSPAGISATNTAVTAAPGGVPFTTGLYFAVTDANVSTGHAKDITVACWIEY